MQRGSWLMSCVVGPAPARMPMELGECKIPTPTNLKHLGSLPNL
jgi:hypothetical protein